MMSETRKDISQVFTLFSWTIW